MHKHFLTAIAITLFAACLPATADTIEDFSSFTNSVSSFPTGSAVGQVITDGVGSTFGSPSVSGIDGDSLFLGIDTSSVPAGSNGYGGGVQTSVTDAGGVGAFTSGSIADYNLVFDAAAVGFDPRFVDVIVRFQGTGFQGNQNSINQGSTIIQDLISDLSGTDAASSFSIALSDLGFTDADAAAFSANADTFQFQFFNRSNEGDYTSGQNVLVLDNVGVTIAAIPEPTSATLLIASAIGLLSRRRRTA